MSQEDDEFKVGLGYAVISALTLAIPYLIINNNNNNKDVLLVFSVIAVSQ